MEFIAVEDPAGTKSRFSVHLYACCRRKLQQLSGKYSAEFIMTGADPHDAIDKQIILDEEEFGFKTPRNKFEVCSCARHLIPKKSPQG